MSADSIIKQQSKDDKTQIRDAAVLIVVDTDAPEPSLLMGKRNKTLAFMPGKYVFPGGSIDPEDYELSVSEALPESEVSLLMQHTANFNSTAEAHALPLAAIRETYEETGILIGKKERPPQLTSSQMWNNFMSHGVMPALSGLKFCARAITPKKNVRRYDTRFFCVEARNIVKHTPFQAGELDNIEWLTLTEASSIDLPRITRVILNDIIQGIQAESLFEGRSQVPFYYTKDGIFHRDVIR